MASLLLGCGALLSERLSKKRSARRESKREYDKNFENLKAENMRRESWIQRNDTARSNLYDTANVQSEEPPSYDDVALRKSGDVTGRVGRTSNERMSRLLVNQRVLEGSTEVRPGHRSEARDVALGRW